MTDCIHCGQNPGEVCRGCHERARRTAPGLLRDGEIETIQVRFEDGCATPDDLRGVFVAHDRLLAKVNELEWKHAGQKKAIELLQKGFESTCEQHDALKQSSRATAAECDRLRKQCEQQTAAYDRLRAAIAEHHGQRADDRCVEDDDKLYAAAGLPPCDRRVGDKAAMLANCARYIERRCEGGGWPSYRELEQERDRLRAQLARLREALEPLVRPKGCESVAEAFELRRAAKALEETSNPTPPPSRGRGGKEE